MHRALALLLLLNLALVAQTTPEQRGRVDVIVLLREQADLSAADRLETKEQKGHFVWDTLVRTAQRTQGPLLEWLGARGAYCQRFYIVNAIRVVADVDTIDAVARRNDVWKIEKNPRIYGLLNTVRGGTFESSFAVEPGVAAINAPQVWTLGFDGTGIVVGGQDTGYQWDHPALKLHYRGWNASTSTANHDFNWHDAIHSGGGGCGANAAAPCDDNAHGTHTMGTACGDDGVGNQVGVAPGAQFICARNMDQGNGTPATYIECFEFFLAPYPVGGTPLQGNPSLAPHVTTNSWACPPSEGCAATSLLLACQAQRAAGIVTVGAAGNSGSSCSTCADPLGIYDEVWTVGAYDIGTSTIAGFSSRGPVTVDGSNRMKPDICAPGTGVRSCVPGNGYAGGWSGTSMATPHAAGAVALLLDAHPALIGQVNTIEAVLNNTSSHINSASCSSSGTWPNNVYGHGFVDVLAAVNAVRAVALLPSTTSVGMGAGQTAVFPVLVQNNGYLTDTFSITASGGSFTTSLSASSVTIPAGGAASVTLSVFIPGGAALNQTSASLVTATSLNWAAATSTTASLVTTVSALAPVLSFSQPGGPGTGVMVNLTSLIPGHAYHTIFSGELCPQVGSGPYFGLCSSDFGFLVSQFLLPAGVQPFHIIAPANSLSMGPYLLPSGITLDALCFDLTGGALGGIGQVERVTVQ
ncbi:MAG: hypothetical protein EXS14_07105 [Planctomycetes bacterium]|nr:hypothetical protein [Planctomycetota bacterium]